MALLRSGGSRVDQPIEQVSQLFACHVEGWRLGPACWQAMSKKGVLRPLVFDRREASLVADLICARLRDAKLVGTRFEGAFEFGQRLHASLTRARQQTKDQITVYNVDPAIAEAAFWYLMLFTHDDTAHLVTDEQGGALIEITATIALAQARTAKPRMSRADIEARLHAYRDPGSATVEIPDDRWYRRLKHRISEAIQEEEDWNQLVTKGREPVPDFMKRFLAPPTNTEE